MIEITTEVGRLVSGHPMIGRPKKDKAGQPKMQKDGITPQISFYGGIAIAKKPNEQHWNQTEWGAKIWNEAMSAFPNGEFNHPTFAFKIDDGDSQIPNKRGKIPSQREGWPGHWVIHASDGFPFACYHDGKFNPYESIKDKNEIKTGDYCQFVIQASGNNINGKVETDGMYLNFKGFNLVRAGQKIVGDNDIDASTTFGASNRQLPANALVDTAVAPAPVTQQPGTAVAPAPVTQQPGTAVAPAPDFLTPPPPVTDFNVNVDGKIHQASALKTAGWSDDQIAHYPRA